MARVYNNTYHCFKYCNNNKVLPLNEDAFTASQKQLDEDMNTKYETFGGETQYKFISPRIIVEEDIISGGKTATDVTFWWLANGNPLFVSHQCGERKKNQQGFQMKRVFVSTDFSRLPIIFNRDTCEDTMPEKPKSWETQLKVAKQIGKLFPGEVVRLGECILSNLNVSLTTMGFVFNLHWMHLDYVQRHLRRWRRSLVI